MTRELSACGAQGRDPDSPVNRIELAGQKRYTYFRKRTEVPGWKSLPLQSFCADIKIYDYKKKVK